MNLFTPSWEKYLGHQQTHQILSGFQKPAAFSRQASLSNSSSKQPEVRFRHLPAHQVQIDDARWLVKMAEAGYGMQTGVDLMERALAGRIVLWRVEGSASGLLATKIGKNQHGKMLWIEGIAGTGLVAARFAFRDALVEMARRAGCKSFCGEVFRPGMRKMIEDTQLPPIGVVFGRMVS